MELYRRGAETLRAKVGDFQPRVLLILGSGLGALGDTMEQPVAVPFGEVPGMHSATAPDHQGRFLFGQLAGQRVMVMQGRLHTYEGCSFADAAYPVRLARLLGTEGMLITNAAGAVNTQFAPGELMLITDHIKLFGGSPLTGPNLPEFGPRFPDLSAAYTPRLQELAASVAARLSIPLRRGVYMFFPGPQYETPAEIRAARILGADAVGMSTVPEVIAAAHCGMDVLGVALLTNMAAGVLSQPLSEEEVIAAGRAAAPRFSALVRGILTEL